MPEKTCACGRPMRDQVTICGRCENRTRYHLADQAAHHEELITALTRQVRMNAASDGGRAASRALGWAGMGDRFLDTISETELSEIASTLPPARPAAAAMHDQRHTLVGWCRLLVEEEIAPKYPADSIPAMACFIEAHLPELRKHQAAGELVDELRQLHGKIMRVIDTPENRTRVHVGPCPYEWVETIEGGGEQTAQCQGEIDAIFPRDPDERPVIRCGMCRSEWTAEHWTKVGEKIGKRKQVTDLLERALYGGSRSWQTVQDAAKMLGVTEREIRRGVEKRRIRHLIVGGGAKRKWYLVDWGDATEWAQRAA